MSNALHRARLILSVVETDATFARITVRGEPLWVGKCLFCQAKLVVPLDGRADTNVTVEHIVPRHHGGTNAPENLALACKRCNGEKGRRHDNQERKDERRIEVTTALIERRKLRWPDAAPSPQWPESSQSPSGAPGIEPEATQSVQCSVSALWIYPLKSARGVRLDRAQVTDRGFAHDRRFMVIDERGSFLSQRRIPRMATIAPQLMDGGLWLSAPQMPPLAVQTPGDGASEVQAEVWGEHCEALDTGDEAARWLSRFLGQAARLVYMPSHAARLVDTTYARRAELVSFADGFPFLVTTEASLDELNERLDEPVTMDRFRPNIVIAGASAGDEDRWQRVQIGTLRFSLVKPCARCSIVTVNQQSGALGQEPLRTLATYRKQGNAVIFGQNALCEGEGEVRVGDLVSVLSAR